MKISSLTNPVLNRWINNKFIRNVSVMMYGTAIAQMIAMIIVPVLSRIYQPDQLGVFSLYVSIITLFSVIASFRYEVAIVLPKDEDEATRIFLLSCIITVLLSAVLLIFCLFFDDSIARLFGSPELKKWLIWVPISVCAMGLYQCLNYWSTRQKQYKRMSKSLVGRQGSIASTQIAAGSSGFASMGLIGGQIVGQVIASAIWLFQTWRENSSLFKRNFKVDQLRQAARKYSEFPVYSTPQTLVNSLSQNLPIFMLSYFYGSAVIGLYSLGLRLIQFPVTLVAQSVRQVLLQRISEARQDEINLNAMFKKFTVTLALIALLPSLFIVVFGPQLFKIILGTEWMEAGVYASWMVIWMFLSFISAPALVLMTVFGLQRRLLIYETLLMTARFGALFVGGTYFSVVNCIAMFTLVGVVFNTYLIASMLKASKERVRKYGG
ncbi:Membrane protein involved in the export of O-antigen and teichoic acid [Paenibacillus catalpae]|uniref:Membrane protein involved in the export of O-antigen and teichoic acid n=1 Tax=Paenibacillus catalpae TaxID=1045775 RepID=A0A1I2HDZ7_9BACL|nr:oligosaccharide flippase family protein [Paenibacillus catalpae]SFF28475.1 Membrane protein involved in the export of O-antigen and teichoic acid [Paenibacillus catalpae]